MSQVMRVNRDVSEPGSGLCHNVTVGTNQDVTENTIRAQCSLERESVLDKINLSSSLF